MNREIKFISRYPAGHPSGKDGQISNNWGFNEYGYYHQNGLPNSEHIQCQYTGLKDKSGVEIYEGDILHSEKGHIGKIVWVTATASFAVECNDGMWALNEGDISRDTQLVYTSVIGNIYEHPHLLNA